MQAESNDRELIEALARYEGISATEIARRAGLAVSTLTRPLNHPVKHRLSNSTLAKLKATFPKFPGFSVGSEILDASHQVEYLAVSILPSFAGMGGGGRKEALHISTRRYFGD